jgi:hypothetical protein
MQLARFTGITAISNNAGMFGGAFSADRSAREIGVDHCELSYNTAVSAQEGPSTMSNIEELPRGGGIGAQFSASLHVSTTAMVSHQAASAPSIWSALFPETEIPKPQTPNPI